ncbi:MAG TPA: HAMP domain-containing sensor histidine kinase [Ktedonobacterales bacterium]|nr:HAMP domain-containing sensor histidine kinase [Ktedonobacterales bacterium]
MSGDPAASDPTALTSVERTTYTEFDRERGLRLARVVAIAFAGFLLFVLAGIAAALALRMIPAIPTYELLAAALAVCVALYGLALWVVRRRRALLAATVVIASTLLAIVSVQVAWESLAGLSALVVAFGGFYIITIALSGVLGNTRMMFGTAAVTSALTALVCVVLPVRLGTAPSDAALTLVTSAGEQWLAAVLTYGASTLYVQALHDLGALRLAVERAHQLDALKDQFITNVNHELRTPIMALHGYIKLLVVRHAAISDERRTALLQKAERSGDKVVALLTSILDTQQLDEQAATFTPQPVDVRASVEAAVQMLDPDEGSLESGQLVQRELRLRVPVGTTVLGEPVRVRQILTNLLSNALKYSPPGTPVEVAAHVQDAPPSNAENGATADVATGRPMVDLQIRDYGPGIPPEQMPLLFHRFVRLPRDLASTVPGNGLGLHLCLSLAEAMGGGIRAESTGVAGEGVIFHVLLPAALAPQAPDANRRDDFAAPMSPAE